MLLNPMILNRPGRDDRGAVALLFALLAIVLFGIGAVAMDLGNAYQRQRTVQSQADLGAAAAAAKLPDQAAVVAEACRNATLNQKIGQDATLTCTSSSTNLDKPPCPATTAAHVFFFATNPYKVKVCSPGAKVDYGLARAIPGVGDSIDVRAGATVAAGTPGASAEMPYYGVAGGGCDYGPQSLTDPAPGRQTDDPLPSNLATPFSSSVKQNITIDESTSIKPNPNPSQIDINTSGLVTIYGSGLAKVRGVGLYRETTHSIPRIELALPLNADSTGKTVTFERSLLGLNSTDHEGVWYVRLYEEGSNAAQTGWSTKALALRVGDAVISCGALANSGNFGSLKLPRTDSSGSTANGWMANNIADGLQNPMSLAVHAQAASPWTCNDGGAGVVYSTTTGSPTLKARTNCVSTDTGLTSTATTSGLITGTSLFPGRLAKKPTSTNVLGSRSCGPGGSSSSRTVAGKSINNDTLSCYLTDSTTTVGTIASSSYSGGAVLDPAIYDSPRFCYVPILNTDPSSGASSNYSIVDVRPCFITGEATTSRWGSQTFVDGTASATSNGVKMNSTGARVETLGVVFFHRNALPTYGAELGDYIGVGPMSVQMVD